ncbi:hypothetical protein Tco_0012229 [Tanacetum coccineum]
MLWEWRGIANLAFIQLGWVSRVDEMILARVSSGFAGEEVWEDIQVVPGCIIHEGGLALFKCYSWTVWPSFDDKEFILFWSTASLKAPELGPPAILATIDGTPYTITEDTVRSQLQLGVVEVLKDLRTDNIWGHTSDPNIASFSGAHESDPDLFTSTNVEDETLGGSFHTTPPSDSNVHANQGLTSDVLGPDVNEDNFAKRMEEVSWKRKKPYTALDLAAVTEPFNRRLFLDEDSDDDLMICYFLDCFCTWEVVTTPLGDIQCFVYDG